MKSLEDLRDEDLLTAKQAASYVPYTQGTLNTYRRTHRGPQCVKLGGRFFYKVKHLKEYLDSAVPSIGA
jgi:hypothetical protein